MCEEQPHLLALFEHYMLNIAPQSEQLFVLGDLFDVWVGDDNNTVFNQKIVSLFHDYSKVGGELFFAHGNRDFLIGQSFVEQCGGHAPRSGSAGQGAGPLQEVAGHFGKGARP